MSLRNEPETSPPAVVRPAATAFVALHSWFVMMRSVFPFLMTPSPSGIPGTR